MPFTYTGFLQVSKAFSPILNASVSAMYSPSNQVLIAIPNINYSLSDNWELTLVGQSFFAQMNGVYKTLGNHIFARIRWSF